MFLSVAVLAELATPTTCDPKVRLAGVSAAGKAPVPDKDTVCGLFAASSETVRVPVREPVVVGVKTTFTVQLAPAARDAPQVFVWE